MSRFAISSHDILRRLADTPLHQRFCRISFDLLVKASRLDAEKAGYVFVDENLNSRHFKHRRRRRSLGKLRGGGVSVMPAPSRNRGWRSQGLLNGMRRQDEHLPHGDVFAQA